MENVPNLTLDVKNEAMRALQFRYDGYPDDARIVVSTFNGNDSGQHNIFGIDDLASIVARYARGDAQLPHIYTRVTTLQPNVPVRGRGTKKQTYGCTVLWIDVDPPKHGDDVADFRTRKLQELRAFHIPPSAIEDSGRGYYAYWKIPFTTDWPRVERINKQLANVLGADNCWDAARILRLPGTFNAKPGVMQFARVIEQNPARVYTLNDIETRSLTGFLGIPPTPVRQRALPRTDDDARIVALVQKRSPTARRVLNGDFQTCGYDSPSEWHQAIVDYLILETQNRDQIGRILWQTDPNHEKRSRQDYLDTMIANAVQTRANFLQKVFAQNEATTDVANAQRFVDCHGDDVRYDDTSKRWYGWDDARFRPDDRLDHQERALSVARSYARWVVEQPYTKGKETLMKRAVAMESRRSVDAVVHLARSYPTIAVSPDDLDRNPWLFNVKNGTVELSRDGTQRLREHRRDDLITKVAPVSYDASAECTRWLQFLHESFDGDADTIRYLQQLVGYSLIGTTFEKVIVFCVGGPDTGKTTLVETIAALFGYSDGYALKLAADFFLTKMYDKSEYDMAKLHGVRYAYASEADEGKRLAVARLKELSGNDRLRGRHPAGRPFDYTPSHTLWLATNHLPNVRGTDTAIWNRLRVIPFNAPVAKARQDPFLQEALTRELSGILNWALTGFSDMMAHGLVTPSAVTNATKQYETENDLVKEWFEEEIFVTNDAQDRMDASTLYMLYDNWCKARNETTMPKNGFGRALTKMGYESSKSGGRKAYKGLRFGAHQTATRPLNVMSN